MLSEWKHRNSATRLLFCFGKSQNRLYSVHQTSTRADSSKISKTDMSYIQTEPILETTDFDNKSINFSKTDSDSRQGAHVNNTCFSDDIYIIGNHHIINTDKYAEFFAKQKQKLNKEPDNCASAKRYSCSGKVLDSHNSKRTKRLTISAISTMFLGGTY